MGDVTANLKINEYTNRVLGVIKERYGLKDKSEAINIFADMFGEPFVDREIKESVVQETLDILARHKKKYGEAVGVSLADFEKRMKKKYS
jgi:hypothetical protein